MSTCNKCGKEIEWAESTKGKPYPINPKTMRGTPNYLHSKTCGMETPPRFLSLGKPLKTEEFASFGMGDAIDEAIEAVRDKSVTFSIEDIRAMAITIYIQRGR